MSTGITWISFAIRDVTGPSKYSLAPRKKVCDPIFQETAAMTDGASARLKWFGAMMNGPFSGRFSSPRTDSRP